MQKSSCAFLLGVGLLGAVALFGSTAVAGPADPARVQGAKAQADADTNEAGLAKAAAEKATGDLKTAYESLSAALLARSAVMTQISTALSSGDNDAQKNLRTDAMAKDDAVRRARVLVEVRQNQIKLNTTLSDDRQAALLKSAAEANKGLANDLINAVKAGADPLQKVADELAKPDATWDDIETARDGWIQAQNTIQLAQSTFDFANNPIELRAAGHVDDPAISIKLEDLIKKDKEMLSAMKIRNDQALLMRKIDRQQAAMLRELNTALAKYTSERGAEPRK